MKLNGITVCMFATAALLVVTAASCGNRKKAAKNGADAGEVEPTAEAEGYFGAIDSYLVDKIGSGYAPGEFCVPFYDFIAADETDANDIQVLGGFWVMNYNQAGDTLKCVSGGSHPGKMHIRQKEDGSFEVTSFEPVGDGSEYLPTAKAIFGERFDDFQKSASDDAKREVVRKNVLAAFVYKNKLPVKYYQDYGWPAVRIPEVGAKAE